jgi:hypothetical protein
VIRVFTLKFQSRDSAVQFLRKVMDLTQYRLILVGERSLEVWKIESSPLELLLFWVQ